MQRYYRNTSDASQSRASSVYSQTSTPRSGTPAQQNYPLHDRSDSTHSRPRSVTPSYMNATVPARKPAPQPLDITRTENPPAPVATEASVRGILLCIVATRPHSQTLVYLERMLKRGRYSEIHLVGHEDHATAMKELKMNLYGVLGKLPREYGVHIDMLTTWSEAEIASVVDKARGVGEVVKGVLCSPAWGSSDTCGEDILSLQENELEMPWKVTVGFLHSVAKATMAGSGKDGQRMFLVTSAHEHSLVSRLAKSSIDALLAMIRDSKSASNSTVAYAEQVLVAEHEPAPVASKGQEASQLQTQQPDYDASDFQGGESPTKLWNMWALQDEIGKY